MKFKIEDKVLCMNSDFEKKVPNAKFPNGDKIYMSSKSWLKSMLGDKEALKTLGIYDGSLFSIIILCTLDDVSAKSSSYGFDAQSCF